MEVHRSQDLDQTQAFEHRGLLCSSTVTHPIEATPTLPMLPSSTSHVHLRIRTWPSWCTLRPALPRPPRLYPAIQTAQHMACVDHEHMHRAYWPELKVPPPAWVLLNLPTALLLLAVNGSLLTNRALLTGPLCPASLPDLPSTL